MGERSLVASMLPLADLLRIVRNLATFRPALAMLNVAIDNPDPPVKSLPSSVRIATCLKQACLAAPTLLRAAEIATLKAG